MSARTIIEALEGEIPFRMDAPFMGGGQRSQDWMVPGIWMTRSGNVIPLADDHDHEAARRLGLPAPDGQLVGTGNQAGYEQGWVRVIFTSAGGPQRVALSGPKPSSAQRRNIRDWAAFHGYQVEDLTGRYANGKLV